jgi:osmotically-inducible protein OsmY
MILDETVSTLLKSNPYITGRNLRFETSDGCVRLHGRVSSWYQKQMAQELLMRTEGITSVENHLEVCWA